MAVEFPQNKEIFGGENGEGEGVGFAIHQKRVNRRA